ncbi:ABC transporter permease [Curtobacterium sp. MCBD17_035]|uniref:ABC transporter permease n=1 Tax=Curtobacterium sp. MCBD17_035 TaxID=2175673 RepID=UPI000DAAB8A4|nr:ABC transporter permease [Curtobacterium sp. MCBD17_035]WIB67354.1 ABC transporter permease [Curtobacterium sp. MCBD17_035]
MSTETTAATTTSAAADAAATGAGVDGSTAAVVTDPPGPGRTSRPGRRAAGSRRTAWLHPRVWLPLVVMLAVLAALWQWGAAAMPYLLPPLPAIGASLATQFPYYVQNAGITLLEAVIGLAIGFVAAFVLAVLTSELPVVRRAVMPIAVVLNVTPLVAIAPALVVAFGFGPAPKLVITALICFFPILINTAVGLRSVPQPVLQVYRTMNASRLELLVHLRVPNAMPYVFAALRIVFPLSIIGAVVAELSASGSTGGLGTVISTASSMNQLAVVYAAIAILAVIGVLLLAVITLVERRALRWHAGSAG